MIKNFGGKSEHERDVAVCSVLHVCGICGNNISVYVTIPISSTSEGVSVAVDDENNCCCTDCRKASRNSSNHCHQSISFIKCSKKISKCSMILQREPPSERVYMMCGGACGTAGGVCCKKRE